MLLYWYQNMDAAARANLYEQARVAYVHTQSELLARANLISVSSSKPQVYEQLTLDGLISNECKRI